MRCANRALATDGLLLVLVLALPASAAPQFFNPHGTHDDFKGATSLYTTNVDGDGDVGISSAPYHDDEIM